MEINGKEIKVVYETDIKNKITGLEKQLKAIQTQVHSRIFILNFTKTELQEMIGGFSTEDPGDIIQFWFRVNEDGDIINKEVHEDGE